MFDGCFVWIPGIEICCNLGFQIRKVKLVDPNSGSTGVNFLKYPIPTSQNQNNLAVPRILPTAGFDTFWVAYSLIINCVGEPIDERLRSRTFFSEVDAPDGNKAQFGTLRLKHSSGNLKELLAS